MKPSRVQNGSSLIEVVVALFVLAVGMLGVLTMQVKSLQFSQSAYYYSQAVYLAYEILDSIRSNPSMADAYNLNLDDQTPVPGADCAANNVTCTPEQLRDWNISNWRSNVEGTLALGKSSIEHNGDFVTITVQFDDSRADTSEATNPTLAEYVLVTEIN